MPELTHLPLFILASAVLLLTPGPAVLYILARSLDQGRRAGLVSVCAIEVGNFTHVIGATLGLSAILLSSALERKVVYLLTKDSLFESILCRRGVVGFIALLLRRWGTPFAFAVWLEFYFLIVIPHAKEITN